MKKQPVAFESHNARALLWQWLQGPLLQQGRPPETPAGATVSVEPVGLTSFALGTLPAGQLVMVVKARRLQPVHCVLVPLSIAASAPAGTELPAPAVPVPLGAEDGPAACRTANWLRKLQGILEKNLENPAFTVTQLADCPRNTCSSTGSAGPPGCWPKATGWERCRT
jgi:hypothetical protein